MDRLTRVRPETAGEAARKKIWKTNLTTLLTRVSFGQLSTGMVSIIVWLKLLQALPRGAKYLYTHFTAHTSHAQYLIHLA